MRVGEKHPLYTGSGYRRQAIRIYGLSCDNKSKCPLRNIKLPSFMYDVDHRDGNHGNNKIENLRVLCVWCHRETDTFGGRNKKLASGLTGRTNASEALNLGSYPDTPTIGPYHESASE